MKLKKGSKAARDYMAKIRAMRGKGRKKRKKTTADKRKRVKNPKRRTKRIPKRARHKNPSREYVIAALRKGRLVYYTGKTWGPKNRAMILRDREIARRVALMCGLRCAVADTGEAPASIVHALKGQAARTGHAFRSLKAFRRRGKQ